MSRWTGSQGGDTGGFCCEQDGYGGRPCSHLREFALAVAAQERVERTRRLSRLGFAGLVGAADEGDPAALEALEVLLDGPEDDGAGGPPPTSADPLADDQRFYPLRDDGGVHPTGTGRRRRCWGRPYRHHRYP
ncbi:hypothetical protein [Georgenia subflava]|uniref:hypothetical protein n=1 Tax=Georgenia subflava TaxID=1622177 RepID=UPI00186B18E5|nr:hypothetical protein [Georgenia subflava]